METKKVHALLLILSDGSTYEVLSGATIVAVTEEGFDEVTGVSDAKVLRPEHVVGELCVEDLIPEDFCNE